MSQQQHFAFLMKGEDTVTGTDGDDSLVGTARDDRVFAGAGNDTIEGRGGNDTIEGAGGTGNDTYLFAIGDGHDIITRGSIVGAEVNTLQFKAGIAPADVTIAREWRTYTDDDGHPQSGYVDLRITLSSGDSVLIMDFSRLDDPLANGNPLQQIVFSDGTTWDLAAICAQAGQGTAGDDTLVGFDFLTETLRGFDGNDDLTGNAGDTLLGGAGNDELGGAAALLDGGDDDDYLQGNDQATLIGGAGSDTLYGGKSQQGGNGDDHLNGDAATMDGGSGNDVMIGTSRSVMLGGAGNDTMTVFELGTAAEHASLSGGTGDDQLQAGPYTDVGFAVGDGRDSYLGYYNVDGDYTAADRATLHLGAGITAADVHVSLEGDALVVGLTGSDAVVLTDYFADIGSTKRGADATISIGTLDFDSGPNHDVREWFISGTNAANTITGSAGNDVIAGYLGNDKLDGADGNDGLHGGVGDDSLTGGNGNDTLAGYIGRDTLLGGVGDDVLYGGAGNDRLDGGTGNDVMRGGLDGDIYFVDNALDQTIELANEGVDTVQAAFSWTLADQVENLQLTGSAKATGKGNAMDNTLTGNNNANTLQGLDGADSLNGGAGNDKLDGGKGGDTYYAYVGCGKDTVIEKDGTPDVRDAADFGELLRKQVKFVHVGDNLEARIIGTTDKLIIKDWYLGTKYQVEDFVFADGTYTGDQVAPAMNLSPWLVEEMTQSHAAPFDTLQADVWL